MHLAEQDALYMRRAIELAGKGEGWCHPNPMVGAVIVKDGRIIGEGYHARYGELHAERAALGSLTEPAEGAALYVTLEPCCHQGRQPPCTDAILEHGIARVVIGSRDPNPVVSGKGAAILREAGVTVEEDFLREECDALNPIFFHYITHRTPYVVMKYAMTADGKIATKTGASRWITGEDARARVHEERHACMGIMAGIGTVVTDDPLLTCRMPGGRQPVRIICDSSLAIPLKSRICSTACTYPTIIACALKENGTDPDRPWVSIAIQERRRELEKMKIRIMNVPGPDGEVDLGLLMKRLGEEGIDSILLEGGGTLNESALRAGIVQEVQTFIAPKIFGGSAKTPVGGFGVEEPSEAWMLEMISTERIGDDLLIRYRPKPGAAGGTDGRQTDVHGNH